MIENIVCHAKLWSYTANIMKLSPQPSPVHPGPKHPVPSVVTVALCLFRNLTCTQQQYALQCVSTSSFHPSTWQVKMDDSICTQAQRVLLQGCTNDATTPCPCALWLLRSTLLKTSVSILQVFPEVSLQKTFLPVKPAGQRAHNLFLKTREISAETVPIYTLSNQSHSASSPSSCHIDCYQMG